MWENSVYNERRSGCYRATFELLESRDLLVANVLVLYNTASPDGAQIANYYAQIHPGVQLLGISGVDPNNEYISADDYLSTIRPQVLAALTPTTDVIVTTKGLPLRIKVTEAEPAVIPPNPLPTYVDPSGATCMILSWKPTSSLESELTRIDTVSIWQQMGDQSYLLPGNPASNPYFGQAGDFSHAAFGDRLTARLDGYSVSDVEASLDRAQNAYIGPHNSPSGPYYFLVDNDPTIAYAPPMAKLVTNVLTPAGLPVVYDNTTAFVGTAPGPVIGYDSHGIHQASTPGPNYITNGLNITLANGSVFNSWESYNAATFSPTGDTHNQGQVAQWLQKGGTAGVGNVAEPYAGPSYMANEDRLFAMLLAGKTFAEAAWSAIPQLSYVTTVIGDPLMTWKPWPSPTATVAGRDLFYAKSSRYDLPGGSNPQTPNAFSDDNAIASDKSAYLPGSGAAAYANLSNYDLGINGIMVDLLGGGNHTSITLANILNDFTFKVGNNNLPGNWAAAPNLIGVTVRPGTGVGGSDRVELTWADNAIQQQWLEVIVKATVNTGLATNDVFYYGSEIGNTGSSNTATFALTTNLDVSDVINHGATTKSNIPITNIYDFSRDGNVNNTDVSDAVSHGTTTLNGLVLISIGAAGPFAPLPSEASSGSGAVASALASTSISTSTTPTVPAWIVNGLADDDLNDGPIAKYFEHLANENTEKSISMLVAADPFADALNLDDELLDSLLAGLGPG